VPGRYADATLRIQPHAIPALREAFEESAAAVGDHVLRLRRDGYIEEPWLGDDISKAIQTFYNDQVMDSSEGPLAALAAYHGQLLQAAEQLKHMEEYYRRTEGDNAALWGKA
jgi:hypothetical protein